MRGSNSENTVIDILDKATLLQEDFVREMLSLQLI